MPPPLQIRSPQRVVPLQYACDHIELQSSSIEASRCCATNTILRERYKVCFKHIEGHTVLPCREQWRGLSSLDIGQNT
jgi:hypothetical protein